MSQMQVKYIFLRKNNKENDKGASAVTIKEMFGLLFANVTKNSFDLEIDNDFHTITYKYSNKRNTDTYYLSLSVEGTQFQCARILNEVNLLLTKGTHRKDYNIILSFDGVSLYFCNKVYPKLNLFERKMRELIFNILVKAFGIDWFDATNSSELKADLASKGMKQSDLIERALYEMTISQLEMYLFTPYREVDINTVIDNDLSQSVINAKTKEEIINVLDKCRAKCLWDRFFDNRIQINNLQSKLVEIRLYRNSVAHSKYFYKKDYDKCNRLLNKLLKQIDKAIDEIEIRTFSKTDIDESLSVFSETIGIIYQGILGNITPAIKEFSKVLAQFSKINIPKIQFDIPKIDPQLALQFKQLSVVTKIDPEIQARLNSKLSLVDLNAKVNEKSILELNDRLNKIVRTQKDLVKIEKKDIPTVKEKVPQETNNSETDIEKEKL